MTKNEILKRLYKMYQDASLQDLTVGDMMDDIMSLIEDIEKEEDA